MTRRPCAALGPHGKRPSLISVMETTCLSLQGGAPNVLYAKPPQMQAVEKQACELRHVKARNQVTRYSFRQRDDMTAQRPCARLPVGTGAAHGTSLLNAHGVLYQMLGPGLEQAGGHRRCPVPLGRRWPRPQRGARPGLRHRSREPWMLVSAPPGTQGLPRLGTVYPPRPRPGLPPLGPHAASLSPLTSPPCLAGLEPWFISPHIRTQEPPLALSPAGHRAACPESGQSPPAWRTVADCPP